MTKLLSLFLFVLSILCSLPLVTRAEDEVVAALSDHLVAIDTGFTGTKVLLFGATEGDGDVVIVVRGPSGKEVVRQKERIFGVWANKEQITFDDTPAFYNIATSRSVEEIVDPDLARSLELGPDYLVPHIASESTQSAKENQDEFWQALLRSKKRDGLYANAPTPISFLGNRLFRTDFHFPANVPVGTYLIYVYLIKDNTVVSSQITPLFVSKTGAEARIYDFAHKHSFYYGIIAVLIALFAGWFASVIFRKK